VKTLLAEREALDIINNEMIPALDDVGKGFEKGTVFLPQLLMSAEAAKAAFQVIKDSMADSGKGQEKKGTIILATVKGDIHDIGKNIVKVLLENYGYEVLDLGKDVAPEIIVEAAVENKVPLVGLSALMTTTVPSMEETIVRLRQEAPWVKIMVGGAVLTEEYARTIGADQYCRDAMASVNYAEGVLVRRELGI
jgi:5-methyltetrahydrofolate--homocysteine methyltransferase